MIFLDNCSEIASVVRSQRPVLPSTIAKIHLQQAIHSLQKGEIDQARLHARQSAHVVESDWPGLEKLGLILLRLDELSLAFDILCKAKRNDQLHGRGYRALAALFHSRRNFKQSRLCIEAMARVASITGPSPIVSEYPNILQLRSVRESALGIKRDEVTGLCSVLFKGGHFALGSYMNGEDVNLFTAIFDDNNLPPNEKLPRFDLFINCLSCPDHDSSGLQEINRFLERFPQVPVINSPERVMLTSRSNNACRLAALDRVVVPRTMLLAWNQDFGAFLKKLEQEALSFPVIIRKKGGHGAKYMYKACSLSDLSGWLSSQKSDDCFYVSQYLDYRWDDGLFHKFRVFFIDGKIYPASHVISDHWEIHCDNTARRDRYRVMYSNLSLQLEEERFLRDVASCLGPNAMTALEHIQSLLGLDFVGIDFALDGSKNVILFEANAAMRQNFEDLNDFPYLRESVDRIANAFMEMVRSRCLSSDGNGLVS